ncbi:MAG TPA: hypothetical protein VJT67_05895, partial [Longimicrobiaceae bacterium]|nr:hypothetical protein [Longimicrobiaceae bacterium]
IGLVEAERAGSAAALARELGIPPRPLRRFLSGADPSPAVWEALTTHARTLSRPRPLAPVGVLGLAVLAEGLPPHLRHDARLHVAAALAAFLDQRAEPRPSWLVSYLSQPTQGVSAARR